MDPARGRWRSEVYGGIGGIALSSPSRQICCSHCGKESFLLISPRYEGFKKVGEKRACSGCGHEFVEGERIHYVEKRSSLPDLFKDVKREEIPNFLGDAEDLAFCVYCASYVENPFTQRCMRHQREVQATDSCPHFERKLPEEKGKESSKRGESG